MAVRTHTDIDWDAAILAVIVILQAALDDLTDDVGDLQTDVTALGVALAIVDVVVNTILAIVEGLPTLSETNTSVTTTVINTEYNIYVNATPLGVFNPVCVKIDCSAQTAGETIVVRQYSQGAAGVPAPVGG